MLPLPVNVGKEVLHKSFHQYIPSIAIIIPKNVTHLFKCVFEE